ncbi:HEXXH motif domain-containing protein [Dactylosporangium sp. CA-092794]|uniref:HEXXH motif domain-containing protein n=1 Tax=Dactylosporangium sp. CA-092794 TaxID=3239929 RepID=UPI003D916E46
MMRYHQLADGAFADLAAGLGGRAAILELDASRLSRHLLLLRFVSDCWVGRLQDLHVAIEVLDRAQRQAPDAFGRLLSDPMVGAWLGHITRRLRDASDGAESLAPDLLHLGAVAASAALSCGVEGRVTAYARNGRIALPALGAIVLSANVNAPVAIIVSDSGVTVSGPMGEMAVMAREGGDRWSALRELSGCCDGRGIAVRLDDGDPYRDRYHAPAADRLSPGDFRRWQALFAQAWELLGRHLPDRAAELATGLRVLVPLIDQGDGAARSATANDSVAALGLTRPASPPDLAITMVHEFQHSKMTAVEHLVRLYEPGGTERHFAPWRSDSRPTAGLIQGVYAFLGVADVWRALRAAPGLAEVATTQFATAREQVRVGLEALESSGELTSDGRSLTAGMRATVDRLLAEPVPDAAVAGARAALKQRRAVWEKNLGS